MAKKTKKQTKKAKKPAAKPSEADGNVEEIVPSGAGVPQGGFAVVADRTGAYYLIYRENGEFKRMDASSADLQGGGVRSLRWK